MIIFPICNNGVYILAAVHTQTEQVLKNKYIMLLGAQSSVNNLQKFKLKKRSIWLIKYT